MTARRLFAILSVALLLVACKNKNEYVVKGEYPGAPDGTVLYMTTVDDILNVVDSAVVKNGTFEFKGEAGEMEIMYISTSSVIDGGYIVIEPGEIGFTIKEGARSSGTKNNETLSEFVKRCDDMAQLQKFTTPAYAAALGMDRNELDSMVTFIEGEREKFTKYAVNSISENINTPLGCFFLAKSVGIVPSDRLAPLFDQVPEEERNSLYMKKHQALKAILAEEKAAKEYMEKLAQGARRTAVGKEIQDFELKGLDGKEVLFSSVVKSGKCTALLFWSSWHPNSLGSAKAIEELFSANSRKGFRATGVSLDSSLEELEKTVTREGFTWQQLCNPEGGSAEVATAYGVADLPEILLIDSKGVIIERGTDIEELEKRVKEICK